MGAVPDRFECLLSADANCRETNPFLSMTPCVESVLQRTLVFTLTSRIPYSSLQVDSKGFCHSQEFVDRVSCFSAEFECGKERASIAGGHARGRCSKPSSTQSRLYTSGRYLSSRLRRRIHTERSTFTLAYPIASNRPIPKYSRSLKSQT